MHRCVFVIMLLFLLLLLRSVSSRYAFVNMNEFVSFSFCFRFHHLQQQMRNKMSCCDQIWASTPWFMNLFNSSPDEALFFFFFWNVIALNNSQPHNFIFYENAKRKFSLLFCVMLFVFCRFQYWAIFIFICTTSPSHVLYSLNIFALKFHFGSTQHFVDMAFRSFVLCKWEYAAFVIKMNAICTFALKIKRKNHHPNPDIHEI